MTEQTKIQPTRATHPAPAANVRSFAPWLVGGGGVLALAIPAAGAALIVIGLALWPAAAATDTAVAAALTDAEQGGAAVGRAGAWLLIALLLILSFGLLGLAALGAAVESGVIR